MAIIGASYGQISAVYFIAGYGCKHSQVDDRTYHYSLRFFVADIANAQVSYLVTSFRLLGKTCNVWGDCMVWVS